MIIIGFFFNNENIKNVLEVKVSEETEGGGNSMSSVIQNQKTTTGHLQKYATKCLNTQHELKRELEIWE